jgi:hypothetical protein
MRAALMEASDRIFNLVTIRAVCPTLSRLGTLVLQEVLSFDCPAAVGVIVVAASVIAAVGVAVTAVAASVAAAVGVAVRAAAVGVGDAGTAVGVADDSAVTVSVATMLVASSVDGGGDGELISVVV